MCGITALYRFTSISEEDKHRLVLMNREMHYRGPDGEGFWNDSTCAFAHKRLSIIGLDNGSQPLSNQDGTLILICNGEIYNYKELKSNLTLRGYTFHTESDAEPILYLYDIYGSDCLKYLRGMFAFCIYDVRKKQLFVARDRVGEKFLYYSQLPTGIVFSTELKAILKYFTEKPQINIHALAESIRFNYPIEPRQTFIEQIKRLGAGEYAIVNQSGISIYTYWRKTHSPIFEGTINDAKSELLRLMKESIGNCLQSDVPIAVLLSGGIDSSAIAAMASESGKEIHVITAGYKGLHTQDERSIARRFASEKGLIHHEIELDTTDFKSLFKEYLQYIDEPVCDVSAMSQFALYKKAKELGFKVLLCGIGGDELFYGYPWQNMLAKSIKIHREHMSYFPCKGKKISFLKFFFRNWKDILYAGYPTVKLDDAPPVAWTYEKYKNFAESATLAIDGIDISFRDIDVHYSFSNEASLDTIYDFYFDIFMRHLCLYLSDRLGMANSIEIRSPLLDYKLVEFVSSLPIEMKYKDNRAKGFYKDCLKGIVPDYILNGYKRGFEPPWSFIDEMNNDYEYKRFRSKSVFYNSMLADTLIANLL